MAKVRQSAADFVVMALSPALIMTLIGSAVFFLLDVFYQGEYEIRLQLILGLFVFAAVLIGRISIEEGAARASLFAAPLGLVTLASIGRFVQLDADIPFIVHLAINLVLLSVIWVSAHQMTWDCTVVDDHLDASGAGLLDWVWRRQPAERKRPATNAAPALAIELPPGYEAWGQKMQAKWGWLLAWFGERRGSHLLGRWVVYFGAAMLPLFGLGQLFIPGGDTPRRWYVFSLLLVYVASALGLLLTTSFLNLRRYLRQRNLEMPVDMTAVWLTAGGVLIIGTIVVAGILPRPAAEYEFARLPVMFTSPSQEQTSRMARGSDGLEKKNDPSATTTKHDPEADKTAPGQGGNESKSNANGGEKKSAGESKSSHQGENGEKKSPGENSSEKTPSENRSPESQTPEAAGNSGQSSPPPAPPEQTSTPSFSPPPIGQLFSKYLKWALWLVLLVIAIGITLVFREWIAEALVKLANELIGMWRRWFGGHAEKKPQEIAAVAATQRARRLADFADPFLTGQAQRMSPAALVQYTFAALEAWGREHDCPHAESQTPLEFAGAVAAKSPALGQESQRLAEMYNGTAYGGLQLAPAAREHLRAIWQLMRSAPVATGAL